MRRASWVILVAVSLGLMVMSSGAGEKSPSDVTGQAEQAKCENKATSGEAAAVKISFKLEHNLIWVETWVNGKGPLNMALDTGASLSVILPSAAARLGISGKPLFEGSANPLMQFLEGGQPQMVTVDVRVGEVEVKGLKMTIYNMPQLSLPTRLLGIKADGVLGYNFISRFVVTIDYAKEEIILVKNDYKPIDLLDPEMRAEWQEKLVERLEELFGKRRPRVKFGVKTRALSQEELDKLGLEGAVKVVAVKSDSPADKAGLVCGDVIYQLNGKKIRSRKHYLRMKRQLKPGQKVRLKVLREDGSRQELVLELPSEQEKRQAEEKSKSQRGSERRDQGAAQEIGTEEF